MRPINRDTFPLLKAAYPQFNWNRHTSRVVNLLEVYEQLTKDQSELARMNWTKIDIQRNVFGGCSKLNIYCDPTWKRRYSELSVVAELAIERLGRYSELSVVAELAIERLEREVEGLPNLTPSYHLEPERVTIAISTPQRYSKLLQGLLKSALTYDNLVPVENYSTTINYAFFETIKADQLRQLAGQLQASVDPLLLILR
jgi:hypothetical protein